MNTKRSFLTALLTAVPFLAIINNGSQAGNKSASWRVPTGVTKIRVRSWNTDGHVNIDRTLSVEPGEFFRLDVVE